MTIVRAIAAALLSLLLILAAATGRAVSAAKTPDPVAPTWSRDIAGIVYKNCATCHHPGGAGPFSLATYADARRWAPQLVAVTQSRFMPPWLPEPGFGDFADVRRLTDHERALIKQWADNGAPEGDATTAPVAPHYDGKGDSQQASEVFRRAITAAPPACDARFDLAEIELRRDQPAAAEADLRALLAQCRDSAETHAALAAALDAENEASAAEAEFRKSIELAPDNLAALLGLAKIELNGRDNAAAIELLGRATAADPRSADAHELLARAYGQQGDLPNAHTELQTAAQLNPDDASVHSALAQVLTAQGDLQTAMEEQRTALKLFENDPDGWNNLGVLDARTGHFAAAREDFEHALRLQPDNAEAKANLAHLPAQSSVSK